MTGAIFFGKDESTEFLVFPIEDVKSRDRQISRSSNLAIVSSNLAIVKSSNPGVLG